MEKNKGKEYLSEFAKDLKNPDLDVKVLALGMGMQSTALYLMSSMGLVDRCDIAVFSDPMSEHYKTYELLEWLKKLAAQKKQQPPPPPPPRPSVPELAVVADCLTP